MKRYSKNQLQRYPIYLKYLRQLKEQGYTSVSSPLIAKELGYSEEQIRKDLQLVSNEAGRPKKGRNIDKLIGAILAQYNPKGEMYRVSVRTKNADGEEIDVIDTMLEAKALLFGDREANTECLQIAYDNLEPAVNNVKIKSAGSTNYLSASIFKRSLFSGTLVG